MDREMEAINNFLNQTSASSPPPLPAVSSPASATSVVRMMHPIIEESKLDKSLLPTSETACTTCPNAIWQESQESVQAYCRSMFLIAWSSEKPTSIKRCSARDEALINL